MRIRSPLPLSSRSLEIIPLRPNRQPHGSLKSPTFICFLNTRATAPTGFLAVAATDIEAARQEYGCGELVCDDEVFPEAARPHGAVDFPPFNWTQPAAAGSSAPADSDTRPGPEMSEVEATPYVADYLQKCLEELGVKFGRDGFRMVVVASRQSIFSLKLASREISGGTDILIVPWNAHDLEVARHVRFLVELKVPLAENKLPVTAATDPGFVRQVQVELLAAQLASPHPILAMLSDAAASNVLLRVDCRWRHCDLWATVVERRHPSHRRLPANQLDQRAGPRPGRLVQQAQGARGAAAMRRRLRCPAAAHARGCGQEAAARADRGAAGLAGRAGGERRGPA